MKYDPIKRIFGDFVARNVMLRKIFYMILDILFLRSWHVRKEVRKLFGYNDALKIFDAGMGYGQYSYFMSKIFPKAEIYAVDVKEEQVEDCKYFFSKCKIDRAKFEIADLTKIDYMERFDFILSVDVMEHIVEDELVFRNFSNALKKGGKMLVNTPSDLGGSDAHEDDDESFIEEHARIGYSRKDIIDKLEKAGFKVTDFKYSYGKYGTISWRLGIKYPIFMVGKLKLLILILPFYYFFTLWLTLTLMWLDVSMENKEGTGIIVIAEKI